MLGDTHAYRDRGARRRPDHRRRPLGDRRGLSPAARCPGRRYAILEARERLGGTWDLFRYPGVRSDSDMHTLGYRSARGRPPSRSPTAPRSSATSARPRERYGVDRQDPLRHTVVQSAEWSSAEARWTVDVRPRRHRRDARPSPAASSSCCSGYYRYDEGYTPEFPGVERFGGTVVHPQHWPEDLDYEGKRVVVIGSGATAVTLVPAMAETAAHVTMLQRSPTYVVSLPARRPRRLAAPPAARRWPPTRSCAGRTCADDALLPAQPAPARRS